MESISNELQNMPLEYLICAPMQGAIKASGAAAQTTLDFISSVGFTKKGGTRMINTASFSHNDTIINVPLLSMIPVPFIRIKTLMIDFDFKVSTTEIEKDTTDKEMSLNIGGILSFFNVGLKGSYKSHHEKSTQNDESAVLKVHVEAVQDEIPAGLKKVLNIFEDSIKVENKPSSQIPVTA